jgi:branched-chain amino acid transport system substrate-binding protein
MRRRAAERIVIGLPPAQTAAAGVADDLDHLNGTTVTMEEINAAGGILGRQLKLFVTDVDKLAPDCRGSRRRVHW